MVTFSIHQDSLFLQVYLSAENLIFLIIFLEEFFKIVYHQEIVSYLKDIQEIILMFKNLHNQVNCEYSKEGFDHRLINHLEFVRKSFY